MKFLNDDDKRVKIFRWDFFYSFTGRFLSRIIGSRGELTQQHSVSQHLFYTKVTAKSNTNFAINFNY